MNPFFQIRDRVVCAGAHGTVTDTVGIRCYIDFDRGGGGWYRRDERLQRERRPVPALTLPALMARRP